jgi:hypothetical protein
MYMAVCRVRTASRGLWGALEGCVGRGKKGAGGGARSSGLNMRTHSTPTHVRLTPFGYSIETVLQLLISTVHVFPCWSTRISRCQYLPQPE